MVTRIRNAFITGIAVILPVAVTFFIIRFLYTYINNWILEPFVELLSPYLASKYAVYAAKIGIFILVIISICFIGWAANILVIRRLFGLGEKVFLKIPMLGRIYSTVKEILSAFLGQGKTIFKNVVLIEYPRKGVYSIGFITGEAKGEVQAQTKELVYNVFVPTTPNPTSGLFLLVPENEIKFLKMTVEEAMKLVISGGAVSPKF